MAYRSAILIPAGTTVPGTYGLTALDYRFDGGQRRNICAQRSLLGKDANVFVSDDGGQSWVDLGSVFGGNGQLTAVFSFIGPHTNVRIDVLAGSGSIAAQGVI